MTQKINSKINFQFSIFNFHSIFKLKILNLKFPIFIILFTILIYTRFVNIGWGLPYPMHPDERNMANAIQSLNCKISNFQFPISKQISNFKFQISNCFNPHFFAYGQFPLYLGYLIALILKFFDNNYGTIIGFQEATISLRIISSIASIINVFVLIKIIELISNIKDQRSKFKAFGFTLGFALCTLIFTLSPYAIQFAHFGTTESLLMLFYSLIIYLSLVLFNNSLNTLYFILYTSLISGLAIATKVSSIIFLAIPVIALILNIKDQRSNPNSKFKAFGFTLGFALCTLIFTLIFSPHNLISYQDFISTLKYESAVATGQIKVFYTRQFEGTIPYLFQAVKVFPYALGWPVYVLSLLGFILLSWKDRNINFIRLAILIYFIPSGYIFAKWTRFMAPMFPLMLILAILTILNIKDQISRTRSKLKTLRFILGFALCTLIFALIIPGLSYLSVYQKPDVRFQASKWIYENIPNNSIILSETANVVDIPISNETMKQSNNYNVISFNFYDLDAEPNLQLDLNNYLQKANYIFVPSRRIFANHPKQKYPILNKYYEDLFSGKLGLKKVAEFSAGLNDEAAEETWTVFDHPTIRIYKKYQMTNIK